MPQKPGKQNSQEEEVISGPEHMDVEKNQKTCLNFAVQTIIYSMLKQKEAVGGGKYVAETKKHPNYAQ